MTLRMPAEIIPFPSPRDTIKSSGRHRFGYAWEQDVESAEFQRCGAEARCVYLALLIRVDNDSQQATIGRRRLAKAAGIHWANTRRALGELEAAGLLHRHVPVYESKGGQRKRYGRTTYTLLCPPSLLTKNPAQQTLPFRRLSWGDVRALRSRGTG